MEINTNVDIQKKKSFTRKKKTQMWRMGTN